MGLHSSLSYAFVAAAVSRLAYGCTTGIPPSRFIRLSLSALIVSVPLTALGRTLKSPPRWRGVFITSLFTSLFVATALATLEDGVHELGILTYAAWAASSLQFAHRCLFYQDEVEDARRCAESEAFFSMCSFNLWGGIKLPCTILNQAFMVLIAAELRGRAGADLLVALALSDFLCVFQLFLARQRRFPAHLFLEGATVLSSVPATAVFAAHGRLRESLVLCGGLVAWLAAARLRPAA
jgi:hypothetical protein